MEFLFDIINGIKFKNWMDHGKAMGVIGAIFGLLFGGKE